VLEIYSPENPRTYAALCEELYRVSNIQGYQWRHKVRKNYYGQLSGPRAVLSVTLFLIAISKMAVKTKEPRNERPGPRRNQSILSQRLDEEEMRIQTVGILGYADDWVLYTKNHQILRSQNNMQAALDGLRQMATESSRKKPRP
jgi:hypothetical protein